MNHRIALYFGLAFAALLFTACGKATVKPGTAHDGFSLSSLRDGVTAVIVDAEVALVEFTPSYQKAYEERFGDGDSLSSYLAARLIDSLNLGTPALRAVAGPALNPRHILHVRNLVLERGTREVPTALLPTGGAQVMQPAGGGTSEGWTISFEVDVWRPTGVFWNGDGGEIDDETETIPVPDSASGVREYTLSVRGQADVPLYAYKTALAKAVDAAAAKTARHLREP